MVDLVAADGRVVGTVAVSNDDEEITVVYRTSGGWELAETHLAVTTSLAEIATNRARLPQVGRFPEKATHEAGTDAFSVTLSLADHEVSTGDDLVVAAHADVVDRKDPDDPYDDRQDGAWGEGIPFSERGEGSTGSYFEHAVQACTSVAQTVGAEGGTVEVEGDDEDEGVTLAIPEGALEEPVEITIEAVDLAELTASIGTTASSSFTTDDLIEGTAYDFGPDGLEFLEPVQLVIGYEEANLGDDPESVEEQLHVFIVNGIFAPIDPSTVDADADEVSAFTDHFTVFALGTVEGVDITVTEQIQVTDEVTVRGPAPLAVDEPITVSDSVALTVESPVSIRVDEPITVSDSVELTVESPARISVDEPVTVTDSVALTVEPAAADSFAYVGAQGDDQVAVIDRSTRQVVSQVAVGNPFALATRPGGSEVYVARGGDNALDVIDVSTNTVAATISPVSRAFDVEFRPDGNTAYAVTGGSVSRLSVIDVATRTVTATVEELASFSRGMAVTPGGDSAFVVTNDTVVVVDLTTNAAIDTLTGSFTGVDAAVSPDGQSLLVTDTDTDLVIFDLATGTISATVAVGSDPFGVAVDPAGTTAYTANESSSSVTPVDLATQTAETPISVASQPFQIAINEDGTIAWVTQRSGGNVAVVDLTDGTVLTSIAVGSFPAGVTLTP